MTEFSFLDELEFLFSTFSSQKTFALFEMNACRYCIKVSLKTDHLRCHNRIIV